MIEVIRACAKRLTSLIVFTASDCYTIDTMLLRDAVEDAVYAGSAS